MIMRLLNSLATTEELGQLFSDESILKVMLDFEAALARVEAKLGIIPTAVAEKIAAAAKVEFFDAAKISHAGLRAGTLSIPLVKDLRERLTACDPAASSFIHWGATSQDVSDTALILLLKKSQSIFEKSLSSLQESLNDLAENHAGTVMLGRTLMQPAPPTTFGLKAAGWLASIHRCHENLNHSFANAMILQFGGASGTLAMLGDKGIVVGQALADELGLAYPDAPWHTHRDRLASLLCTCGVLVGSLAKMARDITLLMQSEIGEVAEAGDSGRGGSSTMPHKQNPIGCILTLAAANRVPGLVAAFLSAMVQENERAAGGWQAEWPTVAGIIQSTSLALESMAEVAQSLIVNADKMRANIAATHGAVFAEKATMILTEKSGHDATQKILAQALKSSVSQRQHLSKALLTIAEVEPVMDDQTLKDLEVPELYLGVANDFRQRLLASLSSPSKKKD
jgi:3-carboxy-cis,cis-muconate cycloisomerase